MDENAPIFYRKFFASFILCLVVVAAGFFIFELLPLSVSANPQKIIVEKGSGLSAVAKNLEDARIIRSAFVFKVLALGRDRTIQAGTYDVSPNQSPFSLLESFLKGPEAAHVAIPEGSSLYDVDAILARAEVLKAGDLIRYNNTLSSSVEGKLFPDTYDFPLPSGAKDVVDTMMENYKNKALPVLRVSSNPDEDLIIASLLEKEVVSAKDRRIVAGLIKKRVKAGMPIQIDATVCYTKRVATLDLRVSSCYPLTPLDFKRSSPYNTYLHRGLTPGPIGSPGVDALQAAVTPADSPYWYYLSDPVSKRTIFSKTLDEQSSSRARYLK